MFVIIRRAGTGLRGAWGRRGRHTCAGCAWRCATTTGRRRALATNYDGLVISVLAEAHADGRPERRTAGRCALRRMRKLDVGHRRLRALAATVSLVLPLGRRDPR